MEKVVLAPILTRSPEETLRKYLPLRVFSAAAVGLSSLALAGTMGYGIRHQGSLHSVLFSGLLLMEVGVIKLSFSFFQLVESWVEPTESLLQYIQRKAPKNQRLEYPEWWIDIRNSLIESPLKELNNFLSFIDANWPDPQFRECKNSDCQPDGKEEKLELPEPPLKNKYPDVHYHLERQLNPPPTIEILGHRYGMDEVLDMRLKATETAFCHCFDPAKRTKTHDYYVFLRFIRSHPGLDVTWSWAEEHLQFARRCNDWDRTAKTLTPMTTDHLLSILTERAEE